MCRYATLVIILAGSNIMTLVMYYVHLKKARLAYMVMQDRARAQYAAVVKGT